jgi:hypothetical protein
MRSTKPTPPSSHHKFWLLLLDMENMNSERPDACTLDLPVRRIAGRDVCHDSVNVILGLLDAYAGLEAPDGHQIN